VCLKVKYFGFLSDLSLPFSAISAVKSFAFLDCTTPAAVFKKLLTAEIAEDPEIAENAKFSVRLPGDPYVSCA
jgi:hypothetical protein